MSDFSDKEKEILKFWQENKIFESSCAKASEDKQFIFYDGPPFATGLPHYGHLVGGIMKDVIPRYKTMQGYRVPRRWGWDCHGLPVEYEVEKELKISGKKDIEEKIGIAQFADACRKIVLRYTAEWRETVEKIGRWVDMDNAYRTMDIDYMESIWWVFKTLYDKNLIYEGYKVLPFCPRCSTSLSNFEANMPGAYKDVKDAAITVKFKVLNQKNTYLLAWTTTPWTSPSNMALAVGADLIYAKVKDKNDGNVYILAEDRLTKFYPHPNPLHDKQGEGESYEIIERLKGKDLVGLEYEPLFPYFADKKSEGAFKIVAGDFVSTEEGTGVVHIAPAFGEDDYNLAQKEKLPMVMPVNDVGVFEPAVKDYAGLAVKDANHKIIEDLKVQNKIAKQEMITHSYPHCWRCDSPLIYRAIASWFVKVTEIKDKLLKNNAQIHWVPEYLKDGRFGKWLEGAKDWAISRNRYWGAPLPVWQCKNCQSQKIIGSLEELAPYIAGRNKFILVRHGQAGHNIKKLVDSEGKYQMTEEGRNQIKLLAENLKNKGITKIKSSPVARAKESAEIIGRILNLPVEIDERLIEIQTGEFNGKTSAEYQNFFADSRERLVKRPIKGESLSDAGKRMMEAVRDYNSRNKNETILIMSHGDPMWILESILNKKDINEAPYIATGDWHEIKVNEIDLHRPWIDTVEMPCDCGGPAHNATPARHADDSHAGWHSVAGGQMKRVSEVLDCWFESGAMPYAQAHYPFAPARTVNNLQLTINNTQLTFNFPAEFIAEGIDQTRGWFYTLLVLSTALFDKPAFLNVAVNGLILAEDGKKMSKRLKNYPDPSDILEKYGADALRLYLLSSPVVRGETLCFSEKGVKEILQKVLMIWQNVFSFYSMYSAGVIVSDEESQSSHILDKWILSKLNLLIKEVTENLDAYDLMKASRPFGDFINDLSTWYLRRSRERIKSSSFAKATEDERGESLQTLGYVLLTLSKLMAPFAPFLSETIYKNLSNNKESVHLENWPEMGKVDNKIIDVMEIVRAHVSFALEQRAKYNIPVRQVIGRLEIYVPDSAYSEIIKQEYVNLIKDEVNVKEVKIINKAIPIGKEAVDIDPNITPELKQEGMSRELIRHINAMRKEAGLTIKDRVDIFYETDSADLKKVFEGYGDIILKSTLSDNLSVGKNPVDFEKELDLNGEKLWLGIKKK